MRNFIFLLFYFGWLLCLVRLEAQQAVGVLVSFVKGSVFSLRQGQSRWERAVKGNNLFEGDQIFTGEEGRAVLLYGDLATLKLTPNSICIPLPVDSKSSGVRIPFGTLYATVDQDHLRAKSIYFQIEGSRIVAGVRGTRFKFANPLAVGVAPREMLGHLDRPERIQLEKSEILVLDGQVHAREIGSGVQEMLLEKGDALAVDLLGKFKGWNLAHLEFKQLEEDFSTAIENQENPHGKIDSGAALPLPPPGGGHPSGPGAGFRKGDAAPSDVRIRPREEVPLRGEVSGGAGGSILSNLDPGRLVLLLLIVLGVAILSYFAFCCFLGCLFVEPEPEKDETGKPRAKEKKFRPWRNIFRKK